MTKTLFLLMAQYDGAAVIPISRVSKDYFNISAEIFLRKVQKREIVIPVIRMEASQKSARGVHLTDLAAYIDRQRDRALHDLNNLG